MHYAWPPTHPQRSMAYIQILNTCSVNMAALYDQKCTCAHQKWGSEGPYSTVTHRPAVIVNVHEHTQVFTNIINSCTQSYTVYAK